MLVRVSVIVTVAPGTARPAASVTLPSNAPLTACARQIVAEPKTTVATETTARKTRVQATRMTTLLASSVERFQRTGAGDPTVGAAGPVPRPARSKFWGIVPEEPVPTTSFFLTGGRLLHMVAPM